MKCIRQFKNWVSHVMRWKVPILMNNSKNRLIKQKWNMYNDSIWWKTHYRYWILLCNTGTSYIWYKDVVYRQKGAERGIFIVLQFSLSVFFFLTKHRSQWAENGGQEDIRPSGWMFWVLIMDMGTLTSRSVNAYSAQEAHKFLEKHSLTWEKPNLSNLLSVRVKN